MTAHIAAEPVIVGTVVQDDEGDEWVLEPKGDGLTVVWNCRSHSDFAGYGWMQLVDEFGPLTLVFTPTLQSPAPELPTIPGTSFPARVDFTNGTRAYVGNIFVTRSPDNNVIGYVLGTGDWVLPRHLERGAVRIVPVM
jgi:hypothetical protein